MTAAFESPWRRMQQSLPRAQRRGPRCRATSSNLGRHARCTRPGHAEVADAPSLVLVGNQPGPGPDLVAALRRGAAEVFAALHAERAVQLRVLRRPGPARRVDRAMDRRGLDW